MRLIIQRTSRDPKGVGGWKRTLTIMWEQITHKEKKNNGSVLPNNGKKKKKRCVPSLKEIVLVVEERLVFPITGNKSCSTSWGP